MRKASPTCCSRSLGRPFHSTRNDCKGLYVRVQLASRAMSNAFGRYSGSLEPNSEREKKNSQADQGQMSRKEYINREAFFRIYGRRWRSGLGGKERSFLECLEIGSFKHGRGGSGAFNAIKVRWKILLTPKQKPPCWGHSHYEVRERVSSRYFMIVTCGEQSSLLLCPSLQTYVFYPKRMGEDLARLLHLEEIRTPPKYVLVGHGYL